MMKRFIKVIAKIAKTTSIVQNENTLIHWSSWNYCQSPLHSYIECRHPVWQRGSMTGYYKNIQMESIRFVNQWITQISGTTFKNIKRSKIKATNISETTTLTEGTVFLSNDANRAGSLGRIECCVVVYADSTIKAKIANHRAALEWCWSTASKRPSCLAYEFEIFTLRQRGLGQLGNGLLLRYQDIG